MHKWWIYPILENIWFKEKGEYGLAFHVQMVQNVKYVGTSKLKLALFFITLHFADVSYDVIAGQPLPVAPAAVN